MIIVMCYEVTIGIPVYKAVDYIEKTMESALNQSFVNIEYLVIDDCGDDGSIEILERYKIEHSRGKDIRILYNDKNYGVGYTRNRILEEASGQYLYYLDSDDIMEPNTIHLMMDNMKRHHADVVYGSLERIDMVGCSQNQYMILPDLNIDSEDGMAFYAFKNYNSFQISVCNCLMRISFLREHSLYFISASYWEDWAFTYDMVVKVRRAVLLSGITYHYQCRSGSLSHYQARDFFEKREIIENVSTMNYMKSKCRCLIGKSYLPYLCYNLEVNCFYMICHILKNNRHIYPRVLYREMAAILKYPMGIREVLKFNYKLISNIVLWLLSSAPLFISLPIIWVAGRWKKVL